MTKEEPKRISSEYYLSILNSIIACYNIKLTTKQLAEMMVERMGRTYAYHYWKISNLIRDGKL